MVIAVWMAYRLGRSSHSRRPAKAARHAGQDSDAQNIVRNLDTISQELRRGLVAHHASVTEFKNRIGELTQQQGPAVWQKLAAEAERILQPTLQLAGQIAHAYDDIRRQTGQPAAADLPRAEQLTLISRRFMEDILKMLLAMKARYGTRFSVALIGIHGFDRLQREQGRARAEHLLKSFATLLDRTIRETDVVVRFGSEEFFVILPETDLPGAGGFGQRVRDVFQRDMSCAINVGLTEALDGDTLADKIYRVDTALYSAKTGEGAAVFHHTGRQIELVRPTATHAELIPA